MNDGLDTLEIYQDAMQFGEEIWNLVIGWDRLAQRTVGEQWIRSSDSIAANIAEGYGRYHYKENMKFCYYARGSLEESITWLAKATRRKLLEDSHGARLADELSVLHKRLNAYIGSISRAAK